VKTRPLAALLLTAFVCLIPASVGAHPKGQRPVLILGRDADGVRGSWVIAADDAAALGSELGFGPRRPETFADEPAYEEYLKQRLLLVADEPCVLTVVGVAQVATGYSTGFDASCRAAPERLTVTVTLLHDLSPEYIHVLEASTEAGSVRATLTSGQPTAQFSFETAEQPVGEEDPDAQGRLEDLVRGRGTGGLFVAFGLAVVLGMVHGLTPGHGKTLAAAYLAGARGTMRQAVLLAGIVAGAHGVSTLVLAGIAASIDQLLPEKVVPWLEGATALLALGVGIALLAGRKVETHKHLDGDHHHHEDTDQDPKAGPSRELTLGRLAAIGLIGGLIPGPEAFAVGFLAVALDRILLGVALIAAFSIGLGLVVFAVAALAVMAGRVVSGNSRLVALAPKFAGVVFIGVAILLALRALNGG
jgi:ABC-type nickel/cobalt efflux system permease component RcnA